MPQLVRRRKRQNSSNSEILRENNSDSNSTNCQNSVANENLDIISDSEISPTKKRRTFK